MAQKGRTITLPSGKKLTLSPGEVNKRIIFRTSGGRVFPIDLRKLRKSISLFALGGGILGVGVLAVAGRGQETIAKEEEEEEKRFSKTRLLLTAGFIALQFGTPGLARLARARAQRARQAKRFLRLPPRVTKDVTPLKTKIKIRFAK